VDKIGIESSSLMAIAIVNRKLELENVGNIE